MFLYNFLDKFFFVFHSTIILIILFGWAWKKTRKIGLVLIVFTAFSWFILGIWYGYGYCPCTDWHWRVRMKLGHYDMHSSYIGFLIESITGLRFRRIFVDVFALAFLILACSASIFTNVRDLRKKKRGGA